jgi:hypothetical protein
MVGAVAEVPLGFAVVAVHADEYYMDHEVKVGAYLKFLPY